jgi:hypothetical protein
MRPIAGYAHSPLSAASVLIDYVSREAFESVGVASGRTIGSCRQRLRAERLDHQPLKRLKSFASRSQPSPGATTCNGGSDPTIQMQPRSNLIATWTAQAGGRLNDSKLTCKPRVGRPKEQFRVSPSP